MNGREKEYCYQTEREGECCGGGEKNDFKFKVSSRFPVAPHETLSPPLSTVRAPTSHCLFTYTLFLFAQFTCREYSMVVAVLCKCVCFVDLFSRRKTLLLELKSVGAIN